MIPSRAKLAWWCLLLILLSHRGGVDAIPGSRWSPQPGRILQVDDGLLQELQQGQPLVSWDGTAVNGTDGGLANRIKSSVKNVEAEFVQGWSATALFQAFAALSRNASNFTTGLLDATAANRRLQSLGAASLATVVPTGVRAADFSEILRSLGSRSPQSAELVRQLASMTSNQTGRIFGEVAMRSALFKAGMLALEQQSLHKGGKAGPSHAYPHVHVVGRNSPRSRDAAHARAIAPRSEGTTDMDHSLLKLGAWWLFVTVVATLAVAVSILLSTSRKGRLGPREHVASMVQQEEKQQSGGAATLSVWDGTVAIFSCIVGTGLLAMPYAFSLAGMVAAPMIIFFVLSSAYTAHLLSWSLNGLGQFSLEALVERALGRRMRRAVSTFLIVELWGYLLSALVCGSMNVAQLAEGLDPCWAVGVFALSAYALSFVPAHVMTRVNVLSNISFISCCLMFIITGLMLPAKPPPGDVQLVKPQGLISAAGILVFSPAGHSFYPALMERMQEPAKFPLCVRRAYAAACALYLAVAATGYALFGNAAQPSAVMNIGSDLSLAPLPNLGWMNSLAAAGMAAKMLALSTLVLTPLISTVKSALVGRVAADPAALGRVASPCILLVSAGVAARFAHEMATLLNLMGSVFCMNIAFVLPVLCYWRLSKEALGFGRCLVLLGFVVMGGGFAIVGLISAL